MTPGFMIAGIAIIAVHVVGVGLYSQGARKKIHKIEKIGICLMSLTTIATLIYGNCAKTLL